MRFFKSVFNNKNLPNVLLKTGYLSFVGLLIITLSSCQEGKSEDKQPVENMTPVKNVCDLLTEGEVAKVMGVTVKEHRNILQQGDENRYVSQCGYYTDNGSQFVSLMVRYAKNEKVPQNTDEFISASSMGDEEMKNQMTEAVKNGTEVKELGGFAVWYQLYDETPTLAAYYDHYEIIFNAYKFNFDEPTMEKAKSLIQMLINKLKG